MLGNVFTCRLKGAATTSLLTVGEQELRIYTGQLAYWVCTLVCAVWTMRFPWTCASHRICIISWYHCPSIYGQWCKLMSRDDQYIFLSVECHTLGCIHATTHTNTHQWVVHRDFLVSLFSPIIIDKQFINDHDNWQLEMLQPLDCCHSHGSRPHAVWHSAKSLARGI